jgi:hypothetical protein
MLDRTTDVIRCVRTAAIARERIPKDQRVTAAARQAQATYHGDLDLLISVAGELRFRRVRPATLIFQPRSP